MTRLAGLKRVFTIMLAAIVTLSMLAAPVLAQAKEDVKDGGKSYAPAYMAVLLLIGLGIFVTCRAGRRSTEVKASTDYE